MTVNDLPLIAGGYAVGEKIKTDKLLSSERSVRVTAEIIGKYPKFCLVREVNDEREQDRARWCILWSEIEKVAVIK